MKTLFTTDTIIKDIEIGELLFVVIINAAHVVNDLKEKWKHLIGGTMIHYSELVRDGTQKALNQLEKEAKAKGYDGVIGVKITHPVLVEGAVEVIAYGNGFKYKDY